jgi:hypothetical protein
VGANQTVERSSTNGALFTLNGSVTDPDSGSLYGRRSQVVLGGLASPDLAAESAGTVRHRLDAAGGLLPMPRMAEPAGPRAGCAPAAGLEGPPPAA